MEELLKKHEALRDKMLNDALLHFKSITEPAHSFYVSENIRLAELMNNNSELYHNIKFPALQQLSINQNKIKANFLEFKNLLQTQNK